jgi:hypothetical protein
MVPRSAGLFFGADELALGWTIMAAHRGARERRAAFHEGHQRELAGARAAGLDRRPAAHEAGVGIEHDAIVMTATGTRW